MVHAHSHTHAARRKKRDLGDFFDWLNPDSHNSDENNDDDGNKTHVVYVTAPATFDGPVGGYVTGTSPDNAAPTVGVGPAVQAKPTETKETAPTTEPHTTKQPPKTKHTSHPTETHPTETHRTETHRTETALPTHITHAKITTDPNAPTTTLATAVSTGTALSLTGLNDASETTSASSSSDKSAESSPTATSVSSGSGSLSGGAKAGIAIGVIAAVGLIAGLILFWLRKKKQSQNLQAEDNEKTFPNHGLAPPGPPPMSEPPKTPVQPPQLNVRPMTQFAPDLSSNNAVAAGAAVGVGSAAAASRNLTSSQPHGMAPPQPSIASGNSQDPFGDPVNPFGNQAEASSPPGAANAMNQSTAPAMGSTETATPADASGASGLGAAAAGAAVAGAAVGLASKSADKDLPHPPETGSSRPESPAASTDAGSVQGAAMAPGAGPGGPGPMNVHRVQMDFNPSMEDELALQSGQLVRLLHEYDDGWVRRHHLYTELSPC